MNNVKRKWSTGSPGPKFVDQKPRIALAIFNPQFDLCHLNGKCYSRDAEEDMKNLSEFIIENSSKISKIFISLDQYKMWSFPNNETHSCLRGTIGASITPIIEKAVFHKHAIMSGIDPFILERSALDWEQKGSINSSKSFVELLQSFDEILVTGEARNIQILSFLEFWRKRFGLDRIIILEDCSSDIKDEQFNERTRQLQWLIQKCGLRTSTTKEYKF